MNRLFDLEEDLLRWESQHIRALLAIYIAASVVLLLGYFIHPARPMPYSNSFLWDLFGAGWGGTTTCIMTAAVIAWGVFRYARFLLGAAALALRSPPRP